MDNSDLRIVTGHIASDNSDVRTVTGHVASDNSDLRMLMSLLSSVLSYITTLWAVRKMLHLAKIIWV